jgi:uncharacterized protein YdaU (DUF1376 family)
MKPPAFQFYPGDWLRDPQLRMASACSRGIWFDLLCHMWNTPQRGVIAGTTDQLRRITGCSESEFAAFLEELEKLSFGDLSRENDGDLRIVNRRMVRDEKDRRDAAIRQRRHRRGEPKAEAVTPPSHENHGASSSSSSSSKRYMGADAPKSAMRKGQEGSKGLAKSAWPDDMTLTDEMKQDAFRIADELKIVIDPEGEFGAWHDDCLANGRKYADWQRAWCSRIRNAKKFGAPSHAPTTTGPKIRTFAEAIGRDA